MASRQLGGSNGWNVASAVIVSVAVVFATYLFGTSLVRTKGADEVIRVTGSARMEIRSDLIIWDSTVKCEAPTVAAAYTAVKADVDKVVTYLKSQGIGDSEIRTRAIVRRPLYAQVAKTEQATADTFRTIQAYELSQVIEVRSSNVDLVDKVSAASTDLMASGINLESNPPEYLYTKIADAKVQILSKAAEDARHRAEEIAKSSGGTLGGVRFARMSPLQITPRDSMEISGEGANDTTSLEKAITAIVSMGFSVK